MKPICVRASVVAAIVLTAGSALAAPTFTTKNGPAPGERSHQSILQRVYGGSWSGVGLRDFTNGTISAVRVADGGLAMGLPITGGAGKDDQIWLGGEATVIVRDKQAADTHSFGWVNGTTGGTFQPITLTTNFDAPITVTLGTTFRWALCDSSINRLYTSNPANNKDSNGDSSDQMMTYRISGLGVPGTTYLLFWEDRIRGLPTNDRDFNDAVIEVRAVPTPGALVLAGLGIAGIVTRRRR